MNKKSFFQFIRFGIVGVLNTLIDFGVLNFLSFIFNIAMGWPVIVFKTAAVGAAMTNSYFFNKHWVFQSKEGSGRLQESVLFVVFTVFGMSLNAAIVYYFSTYLNPIFGITEIIWLNIGNVLATIVSLFWNFFWYKYLVFRPINPKL